MYGATERTTISENLKSKRSIRYLLAHPFHLEGSCDISIDHIWFTGKAIEAEKGHLKEYSPTHIILDNSHDDFYFAKKRHS